MSQDAATAEAWLLTRAIAPRPMVRVAAVEASGAVLNQYSRTWPVDRVMAPVVPWAVPLASTDGFRLLAFDLDAKRGDAAADAAVLERLLDGLSIRFVVCRSGPSDGRHVWVATATAIDPGLVGTLARLAAAVLPSLDIAPLRNPATGCVRPPGAPHRDGGRSELLAGDLDCLRAPTVDAAGIEELVRVLAEQVTGRATEAGVSAASVVRLDGRGQPYLPGAKRPLPAASSTALQTVAADADASVVLNTVLLGAASSHWRLVDVAELVASAPGLEHVRTRRTTRGRVPRGRREQAETLARQWRYAIQYVVDHPRQAGFDASFDSRAGTLANLIRDRQEQADAAPGRWRHGGGPADRRVLDCLHRFALAAVTATVEADIRRVALAAGIGRETARVALLRLAADGWIRHAGDAAGVHGARWTIDPHDALHSTPDTGRSQAATRPEGAGAAERLALLQQLEQHATLATHDAFTGMHALPLAAGDTYARLHAGDSDAVWDEELLQQLLEVGLVARGFVGWTPAPVERRDQAAQRLGVAGRLQGRQARYGAERAAWSWWQAEHDWMCQPGRRRDRRPRPDQTPLWQIAGATRYPKHPRGPDGRADWAAARHAIDDGTLSPALTLAAA